MIHLLNTLGVVLGDVLKVTSDVALVAFYAVLVLLVVCVPLGALFAVVRGSRSPKASHR